MHWQWNQFQPPGIGCLSICRFAIVVLKWQVMEQPAGLPSGNDSSFGVLGSLQDRVDVSTTRKPSMKQAMPASPAHRRRLLLCLHWSSHNYWYVLQVSGTVCMLIPLLKKLWPLLISLHWLVQPGWEQFSNRVCCIVLIHFGFSGPCSQFSLWK